MVWFFRILIMLCVPAAGAVVASGVDGGSFVGRIELSTRTSLGALRIDPATVHVEATRSDSRAAVGSVSLSPVRKNPDGSPFLQAHLAGLPLGVPIVVAVGLVQPSGASPIPTGFVTLLRFRPKTSGIGGDAFHVTLDAAHPANPGIVDFVPYVLEVPPLPPGTSPTP